MFFRPPLFIDKSRRREEKTKTALHTRLASKIVVRQNRGQVCAHYLSCPRMWEMAVAMGWVLPLAWTLLLQRNFLLVAPARGCSVLDVASHFGVAVPEERHSGEPSLVGWPTQEALHAAEGSSSYPVATTTSPGHASRGSTSLPVAMAMCLAHAPMNSFFPSLAPIAMAMALAHAARDSSCPPLAPTATMRGLD